MSRDYVPAAGFRALTRLYDPLMGWTMREPTWRSPLIARLSARISPAMTVVDIGTGTGTLASQIRSRFPQANVLAVDGDPDALAIARGKEGGSKVDWLQGLAEDLPVEAECADAAVLSLVLHHLDPGRKGQALSEARRVTKPGGVLLVADWGRPDPITAPGFLAVRCLDGFSNTADHAKGRIVSLIVEAGFDSPVLIGRFRTVWGTLELIETT